MAHYPNRIQRRKRQGKNPAYHSAACRKHLRRMSGRTCGQLRQGMYGSGVLG